MTSVASESEILDFVQTARAERRPFEIIAGGTRRGVGRPMLGEAGSNLPLLDVSGVSGIVEYQPEELIVTARPGTSLAELKALLAAKNQCLGFDPADWTLFASKGNATLGGAVSADASCISEASVVAGPGGGPTGSATGWPALRSDMRKIPSRTSHEARSQTAASAAGMSRGSHREPSRSIH